MRVTSNLASTIATRIVAITTALAAVEPTTGQEGATPKGKGRTATSLLSPSLVATHYSLGLYSSCTGGRAMLSPISIWPL